MTLRDLLQGVWRMRELDKGQVGELIIPPETDKMIRQLFNLDKDQKIEFKQIIRFVELNEINELKDQLLMSAHQTMAQVPPGQNRFSDHKSFSHPLHVKKIGAKIKDAITIDQKDTPFASYGQREEGTKASVVHREHGRWYY